MDALENLFEKGSSASYEQILNELLTDKAIELKTEIPNPLALAQLAALSAALKDEGCPRSAKVIDDFIAKYLLYMVSNKRKSRTEIVSAFNQIFNQKMALRSRLLGRNDQELIK